MGWLAWAIPVAIVVIILLWVWGSYNGFVKLKNMVQEAFSTMDVYLKKRYDLIPNLVETVKGYAQHEKETFEKVISARNMAASATTVDEKVEKENILQGTLKSLFAIAEAYPDLKANANFMQLQGDLNRIEEDIANSRKYYNAVVKQYNIKREAFPSNIISGMFGFEKRSMFEVAGEQERENVKVQF
jgi:LemA protein